MSLSSMAGVLKPGIVHRLDKDTSGLLVVAKNDEAHRALSRQFAERRVYRAYLALVYGIVQQDEGTVEAPIGRHPVMRQRMAVRYGVGREALTRYRVVQRFSSSTLLELFPQTGRTHQLRVHLAYLGHPIVGDPQYGIHRGSPLLRDPLRADKSRRPSAEAHLQRPILHAHRLGFQHPTRKAWVEFSSPLPDEVDRVIKNVAFGKFL
jgi:23S rRNA pseudouridine1911/1915/1917 synthase